MAGGGVCFVSEIIRAVSINWQIWVVRQVISGVFLTLLYISAMMDVSLRLQSRNCIVLASTPETSTIVILEVEKNSAL